MRGEGDRGGEGTSSTGAETFLGLEVESGDMMIDVDTTSRGTSSSTPKARNKFNHHIIMLNAARKQMDIECDLEFC